MSRRIRIWLAISGAAIITGAVFVWSQYGEYDTRDIPSTFRIRAETEDGYHVHAQVGYEHTRKIPILCYNPFSGYGGSRFELDDLKDEWTEIRLKKRWGGLCRNEVKILGIHCDKNEKWIDTAITSGVIAIAVIGEYPTIGSRISINRKNRGTKYSECDFDCATSHGNFKLDSKSSELSVYCNEAD